MDHWDCRVAAELGGGTKWGQERLEVFGRGAFSLVTIDTVSCHILHHLALAKIYVGSAERVGK